MRTGGWGRVLERRALLRRLKTANPHAKRALLRRLKRVLEQRAGPKLIAVIGVID